jgi:hypothetical protein
MGWLAAAACLALAVAGWWPRVTARTRGGQLATDTQEYLRFQERGDVRHAPWSDFNSLADQSPPEIRGVHGEVAWSESDQSGYLTFADLPINDPKTEQYQLWIIDSRGLNQRVSGGVFNALPSGGKVVVPITPSLPIKGAAAFAVTIEPPGGNAVSDMTRRVVIASLPKS